MRKRLITGTGLALAAIVAFGGAAVAAEVVDVVDGEEPTLSAAEVVAEWDDEAGAIVISVGATEDGTSPCDGVTLARTDDGLVILVDDEPLDPAAELPMGCYVYDGTGTDGKVTHGTMVSMVARSLSPHDLDVPKGWIMREVAKEKPTKVKADESGDDASDADGDVEVTKGDKEKSPKDKALKDKGSKDKALKDKGPKEKALKDKGPKEKAPKDKGPKDKGPKDKAPRG